MDFKLVVCVQVKYRIKNQDKEFKRKYIIKRRYLI